MKIKVLLLMGDAAGVGPELCAKVANDLPEAAAGVTVVVAGDKRVYEEARAMVGDSPELETVTVLEEVDRIDAPIVFWDVRSEDPASIPRREVSAAAGRGVLHLLMSAIDLAREGQIGGIVYAPFNKESIHLAGSDHYSELELFKEQFDRPDITGEFTILDDLWISRVTSHIPVSEIVQTLSVERIARTIKLLGAAQEQVGVSPVLAIAALNPHAGEHGMFGDEEGRLIVPAIESVASDHPGWKLDGPIPADTLFPRVLKGGYTGVVGMYHEQLQIATKLIGFERGVTFHPGMKVPIATAAHGTAFDIQGTGKAHHQALRNALAVVSRMAIAAGAQS